MRGVFMADRSPGGAEPAVIVVAEQGEIEVDPVTGDRFLRLERGRRYRGEPGEASVQVTEFQVLGQRLQTQQERAYPRLDTWPTRALLDSSEPGPRATLQWRLSLVLLAPVVSLIALALSRTDHRRGRYIKMFQAFLRDMAYLVSLGAARDAVAQGRLPTVPGLWWVNAVLLVLALALLYGPRSGRRLREGGRCAWGAMSRAPWAVLCCWSCWSFSGWMSSPQWWTSWTICRAATPLSTPCPMWACRCRPGSMNTCPSLPWSAAWPAWGPWRAAASWWPCAPPACRCSASAPMPSTPRCG